MQKFLVFLPPQLFLIVQTTSPWRLRIIFLSSSICRPASPHLSRFFIYPHSCRSRSNIHLSRSLLPALLPSAFIEPCYSYKCTCSTQPCSVSCSWVQTCALNTFNCTVIEMFCIQALDGLCVWCLSCAVLLDQIHILLFFLFIA